VFLLAYLVAGPILFLLLVPLVEPEIIGYWFGINVAFLLIGLKGFPNDAVTRFKRFLRVVLGFVFYISTGLVVSALVEMSAIERDNIWILFFLNALKSFITFWGAIFLCQKTGLYNQVKTEVI
jgi:hypothetical protein